MNLDYDFRLPNGTEIKTNYDFMKIFACDDKQELVDMFEEAIYSDDENDGSFSVDLYNEDEEFTEINWRVTKRLAKSHFHELYQGSMVAVAKIYDDYFFKRNEFWIATKKGISIIEADRSNGGRALAKKHGLSL